MTDRELLELAAKAAGMVDFEYLKSDVTAWECMAHDPGGSKSAYWSPLTNDGDALRLAVKLGLVVDTHGKWSRCGFPFEEWKSDEKHEADPYAATRRAIVRTAAEIGKVMP